MRSTWMVIVAIALGGPAAADPARASWDVGLDVHGTDADYAARRPIGIAGGLRYYAWELGVVLDPLVFADGWEMLDVTGGRWLAEDRVELIAGLRQTSGSLAEGRRYDEALLLGADGALRLSHDLRFRFGAELSTSIVRHGADVPRDTISFSDQPWTRLELLFHARFEFVSPL